jgi:hypothetical protein
MDFKQMALDAAVIHRELELLSQPLESGGSQVPDRSYKPEELKTPPKVILFMFDISFSMNGKVGDSSTRIAACKEQLCKMLTNPKIVGPNDLVGVVAFGFAYKYMIPIGPNRGAEVQQMVAENKLEAAMKDYPVPAIDDKRYAWPAGTPQAGQKYTLGSQTWFFSTLTALCRDLKSDAYKNYPKFLIALTDGEPTPSGGPAPNPGTLTETETDIEDYCHGNSMILIAVSSDIKDEEPFKTLAAQTTAGGGIGKYIAAKDISDSKQIADAFSAVEAALVDVSGASETA